MQYLKNLSYDELKTWLLEQGEKPFRADQIFYWLYQRAVDDFDKFTDLGLDLRRKLKSAFELSSLHIAKKLASALDTTEKYLLGLRDGNAVESVIMPYDNRCTICVSTQVGCSFHCTFCASGKRGLIRNLETAEILDQVSIGRQIGHPITHVVFMGMGEPLDNFDNLIKAIRILNHPKAFNIGARRITISTCGIPEGIKKLSLLDWQIELSISLHGPNSEIRNRLMPVNKKYPLAVLMKAVKEYIKKTDRQVTFEYTLIKDINSSDANALELAELLRELNCKVNLIPFNVSSVVGKAGIPASVKGAKVFQSILTRNGIKSTIRNSRGADISAACGQLSAQHKLL